MFYVFKKIFINILKKILINIHSCFTFKTWDICFHQMTSLLTITENTGNVFHQRKTLTVCILTSEEKSWQSKISLAGRHMISYLDFRICPFLNKKLALWLYVTKKSYLQAPPDWFFDPTSGITKTSPGPVWLPLKKNNDILGSFYFIYCPN